VSGTIRLEKLGKPGIFVITANFAHDARSAARDHGMPTVRLITVPDAEYYENRISAEKVRPVAEKAMDTIIDGLIRPLTPEEAKPKAMAKEILAPVEVTADDDALALEKFNDLFLGNRWGDGLPLIPPTPERVRRMLTGTSRPPHEVIGTVAPKNGIATVEKIAINAVMAGAKPEYLPVIIAAMEGLLDKEYDLMHPQISTGSFTFLIAVTGPIAKEIGMNSGIGLLGHGWRANNTIGRAVRLCLINLGHTWPAVNDMALDGRAVPHTFYTFAENQDYSPWKPYHVVQGYKPEDSCVTVSTVGSYGRGALTAYGGGAVQAWTTESILGNIVKDIGGDRRAFAHYKRGVADYDSVLRKHIIVLHPEMAMGLKRLGYTRESLRQYIYETTRVPYEQLDQQELRGVREFVDASIAGGIRLAFMLPQDRIPVFQEALKPGGKVPVVVSPEDIIILVAGGIPGNTLGAKFQRALYTWSSHKTKLIRGATLTQAGR